MNMITTERTLAISWKQTALLAGFLMLTVAHQGTAQTAPDFLVTVPSSYSFDETVSRLKAAVEENDLMVIHEIDPQKMLRMVGVQTKGMRQILFFHPRYMKRIIESNRNGAIEPPLKIAVMEMADGKTMVRYVNPSYQFGRYEQLGELGNELKGLLEGITASIRG